MTTKLFRLRLHDDGLKLNRRRKSRFFPFYSAFRQAFSGGNLREYGDAEVCGIWLGMHVRRLGGVVIHHTTPPCLSACVESSFSYLRCENQKLITDPSLFSNTICTYQIKWNQRRFEMFVFAQLDLDFLDFVCNSDSLTRGQIAIEKAEQQSISYLVSSQLLLMSQELTTQPWYF